MGFDVSYHPVDLNLVRTRVLPFVLGVGAESDLDDLVAEGIRIREVRWRAKAWALAAKRQVEDFDPFRYVWGRPFFITSDRPREVAQDVLRYLRLATPDDADPIARDMLAVLAPDAAPDARPAEPTRYPGTGDQLRDEVGGGVRMLRDAVAALRSGHDRVPGLRSDVTPGDYLAERAAFEIVDFVATLVPGWMNRGPVWPTRLAADAGLPQPAGFGEPAPLVAELRAEFPGLGWKLRNTIVDNHSVGGFVPPEAVPAARAWLTGHRDRILALDEDLALTLDKIDEAMALAARLGFAFCEATEIYSGLAGRMN